MPILSLVECASVRRCLVPAVMAACALIPGCITPDPRPGLLEDMTVVKKHEPGKEYRLEWTGICGVVTSDGLRVTKVIAESPADGIVKVGDVVEKIMHYQLKGALEKGDTWKPARMGVYRSRNDHYRHMVFTVSRRAGKRKPPKSIRLEMHLDPVPGERHFLGPTGIYAKLYSDHLLVDSLEKGSPADGILRKGDRIVAVNGKAVRGDPHTFFPQAIDKAETKAGKGLLRLTIERPGAEDNVGKTISVTLKLDVLGSYSNSAPYDCPKTEALISRTAEAIAETKDYGTLNVGLLGLLATGEKKHIDHVSEYLHQASWAQPDVKLNMYAGLTAWHYSYRLVTLCEYYLLTQDKAVLPAIRCYAVAIAEGQDAAGLWNHRGADPAYNFGKKHGRLYGYGAINQTSIILWTGLILAEKCGVKHPEVRMAIEKTHARYRNWIGKGGIPYGNHCAYPKVLNSNGTSGSIAVAFSLLGDTEGARFYAMLATASHEYILTGHSTPYFNILWSVIGANVAGPHAAAAYFRRTCWLRTITRTANGTFLDQGRTGTGGRGLGASGSALLAFCLGRRALYITGKEADESIWFSRREAEEYASLGGENLCGTDTETLLERLGSPIPKVRTDAARILAEQNANLSPTLLNMLKQGTPEERIGACDAIGALKVSDAVDPLYVIVTNSEEDPWMRENAAAALGAIGEPARKCIPGLLRAIIAEQPRDPFADLDRTLGMVVVQLAPEPYSLNLDKTLFYTAVNKLLDHRHMWARRSGMILIEKIPKNDFPLVADRVNYIVADKDRTYTHYRDIPVKKGRELLERLEIPLPPLHK